jgi:hypothetical protein
MTSFAVTSLATLFIAALASWRKPARPCLYASRTKRLRRYSSCSVIRARRNEMRDSGLVKAPPRTWAAAAQEAARHRLPRCMLNTTTTRPSPGAVAQRSTALNEMGGQSERHARRHRGGIETAQAGAVEARASANSNCSHPAEANMGSSPAISRLDPIRKPDGPICCNAQQLPLMW